MTAVDVVYVIKHGYDEVVILTIPRFTGERFLSDTSEHHDWLPVVFESAEGAVETANKINEWFEDISPAEPDWDAFDNEVDTE
jgi:hypothetical protein